MLSLVILPLVVVASIWFEVLAFSVTPAALLGQEDLRRIKAYTSAPDREMTLRFRVLHELAVTVPPERIVEEAEQVLRGEWHDRAGKAIHFSPKFSADDLVHGPSYRQLEMAALFVPDKLLKAFRLTRNRKFLGAAVRYTARFLAFEEAQVLPIGLLWNDHAISERVYVLSDLLSLYQESGTPDDDLSLQMLEGIERCRYYLSNPKLFAHHTNHGVMQNLALMHLSLMFPSLPDANEAWQLGHDRLVFQLPHYVSAEGVVLEHSAEYHAFGALLLGMFQHYLTINDRDIPDFLRAANKGATRFLGYIRRPDGSLPAIGDTNLGMSPWGLRLRPDGTFLRTGNDTMAGDGCWTFPISGYSIWRDRHPVSGTRTHLVTAWPRYPMLGHFRPMDFSIFFWANGTSWWTDTGYWGYDHPLRGSMEGWNGTNAPHFVGEPADGDTTPIARFAACAGGVKLLSLTRKSGDGGGEIRREITQVSDTEWFVLDSWKSDGRPFTVRWTTDRGLQIRTVADESEYVVSGDGNSMQVRVWNSRYASVSVVAGASDPLAGWIYANGNAVGTPAILIESNEPEGWVATYWNIGDGKAASSSGTFGPKRVKSDGWRFATDSGADRIAYSRSASMLNVGGRMIQVLPVPSRDGAKQTIRSAAKQDMHRYPRLRLWLEYRWKATMLVAALEALLVVVWMTRQRWSRAIQCVKVASLGWVSLWIWLNSYYFV